MDMFNSDFTPLPPEEPGKEVNAEAVAAWILAILCGIGFAVIFGLAVAGKL